MTEQRYERPYLMDLAKLAAWAVAIVLLVLACGAVANAKPLHHPSRGHHVSQSIRHQHEARRAALRGHGAREVAARSSLLDGWHLGAGGGSLVAEARSQIGNGAIYGRASLWCARFVNWVLAQTGHRGTGSDAARSFAGYGHRVSGPRPGAIAVMSRKGGGHVGIVTGADASGNPVVISGNNAGRVRETTYPKERVYAYVVPN